MIVADRREGGLQALPEEPGSRSGLLRSLDRGTPLGLKLIVPVILVTIAGTATFGVLLSAQVRQNIVASGEASARRLADSGVSAFVAQKDNPSAVNYSLITFSAGEPDVLGIWVVDTRSPGYPVVASSIPTDVGREGQVAASNAMLAEAGGLVHQRNVAGSTVLEALQPVPNTSYAVVVWISLQDENAAITSTIAWVVVVALIISAVEAGALMAILEFGVLRRVRRVGEVFDSFGIGRQHIRLPEGSEEPGRDALFNLARRVDQKMVELSERERAGNVISELGLLALQGAQPAELTSKALDVTRQAGGLDRCLLVATGDDGRIVDWFDGGRRTPATKLPVWLAALVRAAAQGRRPILADALGQDPRYWQAELNDAAGKAVAAFVPLAGNPHPIGVMVGVAPSGSYISPVGVSMMEAVATALSESLQRTEAEKARHESEVKSKALATVSHEMRNPLNAMLGFSNLLLTGAAGPLNDKQASYVKRVDDASHHLLGLVNDYLDLARVMAGSLPMEPEPVEVGPEVEGVLAMLRPSADAKQVALRAEVAPQVVAFADRLRLRQVVMNLVSNAIRFTPARGYVRVEVAGGSNGVRLSVIDTGVGIPADRQHLVFTEFAQLRSDSKGGDAGLALALSKRFVDAMGGFIRFTSSEGAGTIFDVWLPGERSPRAASSADKVSSPDGSGDGKPKAFTAA
jgi:signal transduction histidine kinase